LPAPKELLDRIQLRLDQSFVGISQVVSDLRAPDLADLLNDLTLVEAATVITMLPVPRAVEVMGQPALRRRAAILERLEPARATQVLEGLAADERTDIVRQLGDRGRRKLLPSLTAETRAEVERLLQYPPQSAGGIMTTEFVRLDPAMTVGEALKHIRSVAREKEAIYSCYVLEPKTSALLGAVSLRDLVMAELTQPVTEVMRKKPVTVEALDDQEQVARKIARYDLLAVPVLEKDGSVAGFVTVDDVVDVLVEEGTEDILRLAAVEPGAMDEPYAATPFWKLIRKRAGWLLVLFLSEMLTATAMGRFEEEIARAVVLALFVPLIISSGGNSGSQAASLIIRALAVGELRISDWWRVMRREVFAGLVLGSILGAVGLLRITLWSLVSPGTYGPHWALVAVTVWLSLIGVVLWGTFAGSMLPIVLKRLGMDPAVSSAPFVATLVDVTGIVIYFEVAARVLRGTLL
jgi:magnesium transporter